MSKKIKIAFAGGGSGGHIYPGIAVADALASMAAEKNLELEIDWIGNESGLDRQIVEKNLSTEGGSITQFFGIPCGKLRRYLSLKNISDLFKIAAGYFKSRKILKQIKPDCLFSKGGFVSVPPCRAAKSLRIPYYTHECDFTPGLATKLNSMGAKRILLSYDETRKFFDDAKKEKCLVTGNPVRPIFYEDHGEDGLSFLGIPKEHEKPVLLILGGSLGALQINNLILENLDWLCERFIVVHQTGKKFAEENPGLFAEKRTDYHPYEFIYAEMPSVVQAADIVLSRAGANSLWECAVCRKPMLLIPLCGSGTRGDQVDNAKFFQEKNSAMTLIGEEANSENLKSKLETLLDPKLRKFLSDGCGELCASFFPAKKIAETILNELTQDGKII